MDLVCSVFVDIFEFLDICQMSPPAEDKILQIQISGQFPGREEKETDIGNSRDFVRSSLFKIVIT